MRYLLQVDFPHTGPFGQELTEAMRDLAKDIAFEDGLISKLWTENEQTKEAGGVYEFNNINDAQRYLKKHTERLTKFGYQNIRGKIFSINEELSDMSLPKN